MNSLGDANEDAIANAVIVMSHFDHAQTLLPEFRRIPHLPHKPNTDRDDLVASVEEAGVIFSPHRTVVVEEKVDGSQVGTRWDGESSEPLVRNRNHILVKGYGRKSTPAKAQYAPLWNWLYEHREWYRAVQRLYGGAVSIYGEWLYAVHTIPYDQAPDDFIAYDVYDAVRAIWLDPSLARSLLSLAGFAVVPLLSSGPPWSYEQLEMLCNMFSSFSTTSSREGVVVKVGDGERLTRTFKMRRETFQPRQDFNEKPLTRRRDLRTP